MKKQLAICAGLVLLGSGAPAEAQALYAGPGLPDLALPPYQIMSIVRASGLAPLTHPMRRGPYYVLVAIDRVGRQMRVFVDAQLGDIVNLRPAVAAGSYGLEMGRPDGLPGVAPPDMTGAVVTYGSRPSGVNAPPLMPPRAIPNAGAVSPPGTVAPPTRLAVAEPALPLPPPLPRPRPKLALNEAPAEAAAAPAAKPPAPAVVPAPAAGGANEAAKPIE